MSETTKIISHKNMRLEYVLTPQGWLQSAFHPAAQRQSRTRDVPAPSFQLAIAGKPYGHMQSQKRGTSFLPAEMELISFDHNEQRIVAVYEHKALGLKVAANMELIPGADVIRQTTTVVNTGQEPVTLVHLSSFSMQGLATAGCRPWNDSQKIRVHYCMQTWNGEGQWRMGSLEELGLYKTSTHPVGNAVHLSSLGSWSTGRYLPMIVIEDLETNQCWYAQIEASSHWHLELGYRGMGGEDEGGLYLLADGADEKFGGWSKQLQPGESFTSVPAAVGCCPGNFTDAVRELTYYRRTQLKPQAAWKGEAPLIFNDYMNCLWGNPTIEQLLPLIDAAAAAGAEGFCIDAGWFASRGESWSTGLGDWQLSRDRFGDEGLPGVIRYIASKGMIPGVWLEMEVCGEDAELGKRPDSWFLRRDGKRVGGGARWFLNFANPEVCEYMHDVIDRLVALGVGYFKNDYNECVGNGDDTLGSSAADGLIAHSRAFYAFIDAVRARHPRLILENCASGAMRQDYGILAHFHLQSTSDQEDYVKYPSIITGTLAALLPEQAGIWAYPWPLLFDRMNQPEVLASEAYRVQMADGEQTIFNMINGLCGNLYLSGRLDFMDERNLALVKEAVALYKRERSHTHHAYPIWPLGAKPYMNDDCWASLGLASEDNNRVLLAVWRLDSAQAYQELPLHRWAGRAASIRQIYPLEQEAAKFHYCADKGSLTVELPRRRQARLFEIVQA